MEGTAEGTSFMADFADLAQDEKQKSNKIGREAFEEMACWFCFSDIYFGDLLDEQHSFLIFEE